MAEPCERLDSVAPQNAQSRNMLTDSTEYWMSTKDTSETREQIGIVVYIVTGGSRVGIKRNGSETGKNFSILQLSEGFPQWHSPQSVMFLP